MSPEVLAAVSGLGGAGVGALITKFALQSWLKRQEKTAELAERLEKDIIRFEERLRRLDKIESLASELAMAQAVFVEANKVVQKDLNNVGRKLQAFMDGVGKSK